ncbi:meiotically up-regulated gene family-domain-containing protein [Penicillium paradoxum]|uniref:meiotically up-regulated gene family-domain-containing protein n=1 Tax=Penicillium paradoxum TaxID=176176 RepID=UPI002548C43C|nr:meiotically up-regulated gene family-domain-containing protein [Penicillium paradoxum]KAJ5793678.1 meiotically up-regulated gene family-domain-containing protein [Penicillium paradoxum]
MGLQQRPSGQARHTGVCVNMPSEAFGCGIFVSGPKGCARTGAQMIQAVSDIRTRGKCVICGWVMEDEDSSDGDGCKVKIDYVSGC